MCEEVDWVFLHFNFYWMQNLQVDLYSSNKHNYTNNTEAKHVSVLNLKVWSFIGKNVLLSYLEQR